jgi:hypothetical protein
MFYNLTTRFIIFVFLFNFGCSFVMSDADDDDQIVLPSIKQMTVDRDLRLNVICQKLPNDLPEPDDPVYNLDSGYMPTISPNGNYYLINNLHPISFATGKPIPPNTIFQSFYKRKLLFAPKEDFLAVDENHDIYIICLQTGLIKKMKLPELDASEIANSVILGFSVEGKKTFIVIYAAYRQKQENESLDRTTDANRLLLYADISHDEPHFNSIKINKNSRFQFNSIINNYWSYYCFKILPDVKFIMDESFLKKNNFLKSPELVLVNSDGIVQGKFSKGFQRGFHNKFCEISKDGKLLVVGNTLDIPSFYNSRLKLYLTFYDIKTQKEITNRLFNPKVYLRTISFPKIAISDYKKLVAIYDGSFATTIYDLNTSKPVSRFIPNKGLNMEFTNNDKYLMYGCCRNVVSFFDVQTGKELFQLISCFNKKLHWAIVAADGKYDGTKEALDNIKIKPNGLPDTPENYFPPKDKPNFYVDGLLATFFNAPMPDHYWFKTPEQIQQIINQQQQKQSTLTPISETKTTVIPLPQTTNSK